MMASISSAFACVVAFPAGPSAIGVDVHVVAGVRVPLRAIRLACVLRRWAYAAQDVDAICHDLQMCGADTGPIATEVINL